MGKNEFYLIYFKEARCAFKLMSTLGTQFGQYGVQISSV